MCTEKSVDPKGYLLICGAFTVQSIVKIEGEEERDDLEPAR